ncbi:MAG TPA: hypothetical protein VFV18_00770 [Porticoccaceae bacterium]|nr:hypothetical protein [Porticoccaceae bacterium]
MAFLYLLPVICCPVLATPNSPLAGCLRVDAQASMVLSGNQSRAGALTCAAGLIPADAPQMPLFALRKKIFH